MRALRRLAGVCLTAALVAPSAHAGIFDDDEARRAILDLRQKLEQSNEQHRARQAEQMATLTELVTQMRRNMVDLSNQLEQMKGDNARLRGQNEQLARDLSDVQRGQKDLQRGQKDLQVGVEDRMKRFEPQKVAHEGREFNVEPDEKRQYDEAMELLRRSDFPATAVALTAFRSRYPASGYTQSALFWLGNAQYGNRQYKEAITTFRALVSAAPEHPKAPEALLAIANCQAELKDGKAARRTIDELLKAYPASEAAQAGKQRLASIKP
jgi:tol-pal system protein YbgF